LPGAFLVGAQDRLLIATVAGSARRFGLVRAEAFLAGENDRRACHEGGCAEGRLRDAERER